MGLRATIFISSLLLSAYSLPSFAECRDQFSPEARQVERLALESGRYEHYELGDREIAIVIHSDFEDPSHLLQKSLSHFFEANISEGFESRGLTPIRARNATQKLLSRVAGFFRGLVGKPKIKEQYVRDLKDLQSKLGTEAPPEMPLLSEGHQRGFSEVSQVVVLVGTTAVGYSFYPIVALRGAPQTFLDALWMGSIYLLPEMAKVYFGLELWLHPKNHDKRIYQWAFPALSHSFANRTRTLESNFENVAFSQYTRTLLMVDPIYVGVLRNLLFDSGFKKTKGEIK